MTSEPEGRWVPDSKWLMGSHSTNRCRYIVDGHKQCGEPAVASSNRGTSRRPRWYDYCAEHLYGRRVIDGAVCFRAWWEEEVND